MAQRVCSGIKAGGVIAEDIESVAGKVGHEIISFKMQRRNR